MLSNQNKVQQHTIREEHVDGCTTSLCPGGGNMIDSSNVVTLVSQIGPINFWVLIHNSLKCKTDTIRI